MINLSVVIGVMSTIKLRSVGGKTLKQKIEVPQPTTEERLKVLSLVKKTRGFDLQAELSEIFDCIKFFERKFCPVEQKYKLRYMESVRTLSEKSQLLRKVEMEIKTRKFTWDTYIHCIYFFKQNAKGSFLTKAQWQRLYDTKSYVELRRLILFK